MNQKKNFTYHALGNKAHQPFRIEVHHIGKQNFFEIQIFILMKILITVEQHADHILDPISCL